jgi:hypothetical protein
MSDSFRDNRQPFSDSSCQNPFVFDISALALAEFQRTLTVAANQICGFEKAAGLHRLKLIPSFFISSNRDKASA